MATKVKLIADGVITPDQITLTTASTGTNTTAPATTAFVQQEISALVDSSPEALNTLNELAAALGDDANFSTTVTNSIATKAPLASPTFTGDLTVDTDTFYVDSTNNRVGIGTTNPAYNLEIWGATDPAVRVYNTGTGTSDDSLLRLQIAGSTARNFIYFGDTDDSDIGKIEYNHSDNSMRFITNTVERFRVHSSGNISIGSDEEFSLLNVEGSINFNGRIRPNANSSGGSESAPTICVGYDNDTGFFWPSSNTIGFTTLGSERMRIDSAGNVGIGTDSPQQKLHIADGTNGTGLEIRPSDAGANVNINAYDRGQSAWRQMDFGGSVITFATDNGGLAERMRIYSNGIIRAKSFRNIGHYLGPDGGVNVADDSTVTITDNVAGAMMVSIYDAGTGSGALYFVNYQGDPQVIKSSGILSFTDDDVDGFLCIYKTGAANSHTTVFKNRTGATRTIYISVFGSTT